MVRNWQGEVWHALEAELAKYGKKIRKPRPAVGFEVDAEFDGNTGPLLVEIKTGLTASDIYEAFGQLMLYRQLMPSLQNHTPILLVPRGSSSVLLDAVAKLKVTVATYSRNEENDKEVTFSPEFRKLWEV
ncbi:hypothetical protein [Microvirga sp. Mcv34]|uniref:hypothetical protein n=1 Tax=Microvirga sp. Mcv34 TaxID=2926016 RepID=UPI0021C7AA97|nr:hypothetical protein [Microvirga sp. Mcv34]